MSNPTSSMDRNRRRLAAGYLVAQALLGIGWWVALSTTPAVRAWFELMPDRHGGLDAFLFADLVVFIGGSAAGAWLVVRRSRWASLATAFTAGGTAYATLYLLGWVVFEGTAAAGLVPMVMAMIITTVIAVWSRNQEMNN